MIKIAMSARAKQERPCDECGCPWSCYGGCVNPDCTNYEGAEYIEEGGES